VFTAGQPIGLILADSEAQARAGARAVRIEYEDLPAILSIEEAIEQNSFFPHYRFIRSGGDMDEAFAAADHVFEGVARMGGQEHFYLETHASIIVPKLEDGEVEVFASTQNPTETQTIVAQVTGVPANRVVVRVKRLGGGFGGKETRSMQLTGILAVGASKSKRPVRCMLNRDEDIITTGQRHPFLGRWKVGVSKEGKLLALDADIFANGGWSQDLSGAVVERGLSHIDGVYKIPNVHVRGRICKTNTVSNTAFRGFGGPQGMFISESMMEEVADRLGMPVDEFRQINLLHEGDRTHFNQVLADYHVPQMMAAVRKEANVEERREAVDAFNKRHRYKKRGLAMIPTKFGISFTAIFLNQAGALVHIYHDGSILLSHGGTEMGQGLHTKMCMIAAQELGVPLEAVHISETKTDSVANTSSTAASASSDLNGMAVKNACDQLNERLQPYREKFGSKATMAELAHAAYFDRVNLSANGFYKTPDIGYTWNVDIEKQTPTFPGPMFYYFTQGVALAEVEIDTLTGDFSVLRADIKMVCIFQNLTDHFRILGKLSMRLLIMDKSKGPLFKDRGFSRPKKVCGCKTAKSLLVAQEHTKFLPLCMYYFDNSF
jgi:xanthine dehydrogenase/oxidase